MKDCHIIKNFPALKEFLVSPSNNENLKTHSLTNEDDIDDDNVAGNTINITE
jgi:hypothetical protein